MMPTYLRSDKKYGKVRQHINCYYCMHHILCNLDEGVFIHGEWYTKGQLFEAIKLLEKL